MKACRIILYTMKDFKDNAFNFLYILFNVTTWFQAMEINKYSAQDILIETGDFIFIIIRLIQRAFIRPENICTYYTFMILY